MSTLDTLEKQYDEVIVALRSLQAEYNNDYPETINVDELPRHVRLFFKYSLPGTVNTTAEDWAVSILAGDISKEFNSHINSDGEISLAQLGVISTYYVLLIATARGKLEATMANMPRSSIDIIRPAIEKFVTLVENMGGYKYRSKYLKQLHIVLNKYYGEDK